MKRKDEVWKIEDRAKHFLKVREALPLAREQLEVMLRLIDKRTEPVNCFADLGCGGGILAASILEHYPKATGVLVDFSEAMIKEAKHELANYAANLEFVTADLGDKTWAGNIEHKAPYDVIVSGLCIHHQPDERKFEIYQEVLDLLKPGGIFLNLEHVSSASEWLEDIFNDFFIDAVYTFNVKSGSGKSREDIAHEYINSPERAANILTSTELQCQWLRECGFEDVDCYIKIFEGALFGGRKSAVGGDTE